jgi:hypothetical protein
MKPESQTAPGLVIDEHGQIIPPAIATPERREHEWGRSRVGHGEAQCVHCHITNREAAVLGSTHCGEDMFTRMRR